MRQKSKMLGAVAGAAVAFTVAATSAQAIQISGSVELAGGGDFNGLTVLTATALDFGNNGAANGAVVSVSSSGAFALFVPDLTIGSIADLSFAGGCTGCAATPSSDPFLSIGGFTLTATNLVVEARDADTRTLIISGTGTLSGNGYDDTLGDFTLSTSSSINNPEFLFSYSAAASSHANPVPEPASLLLLGSGLLAAGFAARRRKQVKA